ncbi:MULTISPECIES: hypothetical protein [Pseudomonas]|uniref:hypothetical protein n=1 Tax=Pseudomonas TaxID=286 RepID=UPI000F03175E|nr:MULTISPECIES: hypothetical protein [Pseudomonas]MBD8614729.1 hypothetical protein [Pseudomonas putida]MBD8681587.1 hypothetical protein [Pseudomonas sp. CFBP 13719]
MPELPYDKFNNDTYVELLSRDPASDVEAHMFRNPSGGVLGPGNIRGNFSTESRLKAANAVLQFASAGESGLVSLKKTITATLPMPMSLVRRYSLKPERLSHNQRVPIFFDSKLEKFVILMDKRFLRDIKGSELDLSNREHKHRFKRYDHIGKTAADASPYLGLIYDSISAIREDADGSPLKVLADLYMAYNLRIEDGEKVILLKVAQDEQKGSLLVGYKFNAGLLESLVRHHFEFEFTTAYRFGDICYLASADGSIERESSFHLNKRRDQDDTLVGLDAIGKDQGNFALLVIPYSQDQYDLLARLHARMHELSADIMSLVRMHQNPKAPLDAAIIPSAGALPWIKPLLIDHEPGEQ